MRTHLAALATVAAFLTLAGCLGLGAPGAEVVASFYPIEFLVDEIAGGLVMVRPVVQPGIEPHDYEPTPNDLKAIADAKLLIIQGASFEAWLETARANAPETRLVVATDGIPLRENPDEDEAEEMPDDPHTWLDPTLFAIMARNVEAALADTFPEHATTFKQNADALVADLEGLDAGYKAGLEDCQVRAVITNHHAFGYMAARYDFEMIAIHGLSPDDEPDAETIQEIVDEARERNITVIFFEETASPRVAEVIAQEVGATTRVLSPVEAIAPDEDLRGHDYITRMQENLNALRDGMRCT